MEQFIVFGVLAFVLMFFILGKWRYDIVALLGLLILVLTGVIPITRAFDGFSHPAVIVVAAVLVLSHGFLNSGLIDLLARKLGLTQGHVWVQVAILTTISAIVSVFVYNVGALALLMPVAVRMARKSNVSPALYLMPVAFGAHLGGFITLISAVPNIIVATFRTQAGLPAFQMFDFAYVGMWIALAGILFISTIGWRLIPKRPGKTLKQELFEIEDYVTELRVPKKSKVAGKYLYQVEKMVKIAFITIALIRDNETIPAPHGYQVIQHGDVLIVRADAESLSELIEATGLELVGNKRLAKETVGSAEVETMEAVVTPRSPAIGKDAIELSLRWRYNVNLLGVAREGQRVQQRVYAIRFRPSDVLLLQGRPEDMYDAMKALGLLPLAEHEVRLDQPRRIWSALAIFASAVGTAALGLLSLEIAFVAAALIMVLFAFVPLRQLYESIDWPVVVLLGAMIPLGFALESSGAAQSLADMLVYLGDWASPTIVLFTVLVVSILLSDVINTAGAAVVMAPVAVLLAQELGVSVDPFLMAVAIGGSTAFLTPIGHQANTLVMGPGGYKFSDYWRMGLPLDAIIVVLSMLLIPHFWPL